MKYKDLILNIYEPNKEIIKEFEEDFYKLFELDENEKKNIKFNNPIVVLTLYKKMVEYNLLNIDIENIENNQIIHFNDFELEHEIEEPKIIAFELIEKEYEIYPVVVENKIIFFKKDKVKQIVKELGLGKEADIFDIQSEILLEPNKLKLIQNIENKALIVDFNNLENSELDFYEIPMFMFDLE